MKQTSKDSIWSMAVVAGILGGLYWFFRWIPDQIRGIAYWIDTSIQSVVEGGVGEKTITILIGIFVLFIFTLWWFTAKNKPYKLTIPINTIFII
ncbi:MAG: hypothetical protein PHU23_04005 [Dehalococcoidales bacterium]|nr:hypothetical protein [Dehalococcoidales bacterium]